MELEDGQKIGQQQMQISRAGGGGFGQRHELFRRHQEIFVFLHPTGHRRAGAPAGAISAFRGHHWVIEDCEVNWSNGVGIDVGNECWRHEPIPGQLIGYCVIRRCRVRDAGVCGIAGLSAEEMLIEDNTIEGTDRLRIAHSLIGKCRYGGYCAKPVLFRMNGAERGG